MNRLNRGLRFDTKGQGQIGSQLGIVSVPFGLVGWIAVATDKTANETFGACLRRVRSRLDGFEVARPDVIVGALNPKRDPTIIPKWERTTKPSPNHVLQ